MTKYRVAISIVATGFVTVEAKSRDAAYTAAKNRYEEMPVPICHQCADDIDEPTYAEIVSIEVDE